MSSITSKKDKIIDAVINTQNVDLLVKIADMIGLALPDNFQGGGETSVGQSSTNNKVKGKPQVN